MIGRGRFVLALVMATLALISYVTSRHVTPNQSNDGRDSIRPIDHD